MLTVGIIVIVFKNCIIFKQQTTIAVSLFMQLIMQTSFQFSDLQVSLHNPDSFFLQMLKIGTSTYNISSRDHLHSLNLISSITYSSRPD